MTCCGLKNIEFPMDIWRQGYSLAIIFDYFGWNCREWLSKIQTNKYITIGTEDINGLDGLIEYLWCGIGTRRRHCHGSLKLSVREWLWNNFEIFLLTHFLFDDIFVLHIFFYFCTFCTFGNYFKFVLFIVWYFTFSNVYFLFDNNILCLTLSPLIFDYCVVWVLILHVGGSTRVPIVERQQTLYMLYLVSRGLS